LQLYNIDDKKKENVRQNWKWSFFFTLELLCNASFVL